jgi:hypothetical protein
MTKKKDSQHSTSFRNRNSSCRFTKTRVLLFTAQYTRLLIQTNQATKQFVQTSKFFTNRIGQITAAVYKNGPHTIEIDVCSIYSN